MKAPHSFRTPSYWKPCSLKHLQVCYGKLLELSVLMLFNGQETELRTMFRSFLKDFEEAKQVVKPDRLSPMFYVEGMSEMDRDYTTED